MLTHILTSTPSPTELTCDDFDCFWQHCHGWVLSWFAAASLDLICGCWALFELRRIYRSMQRVHDASTSHTQHSLFAQQQIVQQSESSLYGAYHAHTASRTKSQQQPYH